VRRRDGRAVVERVLRQVILGRTMADEQPHPWGHDVIVRKVYGAYNDTHIRK
jgi:hypothetical protein